MGQIDEAGPDPNQLAGALGDGLSALPLQTLTFQAYTRVVLPLDGYVFWSPTHTIDVVGSVHYGQEIVQNEDETQTQGTVTFATKEQIVEFEQAPITSLYVASAGGFRFAFSQQQGRNDATGLWHYFGRSIQPALSTQLLDRPGSIDPDQAVVSNSLPLWLALNGYASPFYDGFSNTGVPFKVKPPILYPSFIVNPNETPPYGSVHIGENDTQALQAFPYIDANRNHWQLVQDHVRITLYGLQNNAALDFIDTVTQYSVLTGNFGIVNVPVIRDAKRTQAEMQVIAMKKVVEFDVTYYQTRVAQVARQLIKKCVPTYLIQGGPH